MADVYPKVGEKVAVRHRSEGHKHFGVIETSHPTEVRTITAVYMAPTELGIRIRDHVGETWQVAKNKEQGTADWMTLPMGALPKQQ